MYRFSRAIYRELAPAVLPAAGDPDGRRSRAAFLRSCEAMVERIAADRSFACPGRFLFEEVRGRFALADQVRARIVIERHIGLAQRYLQQAMPEELPLEPRCVASNRNGVRCRRPPIKGSEYCPSHRRLEAPVAEPSLA